MDVLGPDVDIVVLRFASDACRIAGMCVYVCLYKFVFKCGLMCM